MESVILEKELKLSQKDHQTNIVIPFQLNQAAEKLVIDFSYDPPVVDEKAARIQIRQALKQFVPATEQKKWGNVDRYLPLQNLITLSLTYENQYVGAHHKKDNHQIIIISKQETSKGFVKRTVEAGEWEIQLNAHCIGSENVTVSLYVRMEESR